MYKKKARQQWPSFYQAADATVFADVPAPTPADFLRTMRFRLPGSLIISC
jgi:hypothetical protein